MPRIPTLAAALWSIAAILVPATAARPADPTFYLEVAPGVSSCGVFVDGRRPRVEHAMKARIELRPGRLELPGSAATLPADLIASLAFGPGAVAGVPVTDGSVTVEKTPDDWDPAVLYYTFHFEQRWEADAQSIRLESDLRFRTVQGVPDRTEILVEPANLARTFFLIGHVGPLPDSNDRTIRFSSCDYADLPLWHVSVTFAGGDRLLLHERFQEPDAGSGPAQLVRGEAWLGDAHLVQTSYWKLVYAAEHHNWNEQYQVIFDEPVAAGGLEDVRGVFVQEGFRDEVPARAALLGEGLVELVALEIVQYEQVLASDPAPPFVRGESTGDGSIDVSDAVRILGHLFLGDAAIECLEAADVDDSGSVEVTDAVRLLGYLFLGGQGPEPPFPHCYEDPTPDALGCERGC